MRSMSAMGSWPGSSATTRASSSTNGPTRDTCSANRRRSDHALVCDASSSASQTLLARASRAMPPGAWAVALIKPQFEAGSPRCGPKGRCPRSRGSCSGLRADQCLVGWEARLASVGITESPITGPEGNREFLIGAVLSDPSGLLRVAAGHIALRDLGQQRPDLAGFHRHVRIVQQAIEFVQLPERYRFPSCPCLRSYRPC